MRKNQKEKIKVAITLFVIIIAFTITMIIMLKYNIEGEQNMPFDLSELIVVSSAEGKTITEAKEGQKWKIDIVQYNDIYLQISKNEEYKKNSYIENISVENFSFTDSKIGRTKLYMPNSSDGSLFVYDDNYLIKRKLTYNGSDSNNSKLLQISNQGGNIVFRVANTELGEYEPSDNEEIAYNGTLLEKKGINFEDLKIELSFDIVINTNISKYRGNVKLDLPCGNILTEGTSQMDKKDCSDIIFKRENY